MSGPQSRFSTAIALVIQTLASGQVTDNVATVLNIGRLIPLLKPKQLGDDTLKIRPINIGSFVLKLAFKAALTAEDVIAEQRRTETVQFALSVSRGIEKIAHWARCKYDDGCPIMCFDVKNGFNAAARVGIIEGACRAASLKPMVTRFYGSTLVGLVGKNKNEILADEGSKQGCVAGPLSFDFAIQPYYERVINEHKVEGRAITDDLFISTHEAPATETEWHQTYEKLDRYYGGRRPHWHRRVHQRRAQDQTART
jgi:hypothetical protein